MTLGHPLTLESPGHPLTLQLLGHALTLEPLGHPLTLELLGHPLTLEPLSHPLTLELPGYPLTLESPGHPLTLEPGHHWTLACWQVFLWFSFCWCLQQPALSPSLSGGGKKCMFKYISEGIPHCIYGTLMHGFP